MEKMAEDTVRQSLADQWKVYKNRFPLLDIRNKT